MSEFKSSLVFGSEQNIESALSAGTIDECDILFLNEGKIGWIDRNGKPIILETRQQIVPVSDLPETGENGVVYIYNNQLYLWDGTQFISPVSNNDIQINELINSAIDAHNTSDAAHEDIRSTDEEILAELIEADLLPTITTNDKILTDKNNRIILRY